MGFIKKITKPEVFIRLGLGIMFLYSGYDIVFNKANINSWVGYVKSLPEWMISAITEYTTIKTFLTIQGITELFFGIALLAWFIPKKYIKVIAILISIKFIFILWFIGIDLVTFRDIGLLGASLALISIAKRHK